MAIYGEYGQTETGPGGPATEPIRTTSAKPKKGPGGLPPWLKPLVKGGVALAGGLFGGKSPGQQSEIGLSQNYLNNAREDAKRQAQGLENRFNVAADSAERDYGNIQQGYGNFMDMVNNPNTYGALPGYQEMARGGQDASFDPMGYAATKNAISGYQNFADTGGYQPGDIAAMRARTQGGIRSAYDAANRNIDRQSAIHGGYSPNKTAAIAKLTRDQGEQIANSNINLEAGLADQIRQGKLAGLSGMGGLGQGQQGLGLQLAGLNQNTRQAGLQGLTGIDQLRLGGNQAGLSGMTSLYGATPGRAAMYGNQLGQSTGNLTNLQGLQNQISDQALRDQQNKSQQPSGFDKALGRVGGLFNLGGKIFG